MEGTSPTYKVYFRRHLILLSYALSQGTYLLSQLRTIPIVSSYAEYHKITNEITAPPIFGVDSFTAFPRIILLISYLPASIVLNKWGLNAMVLGSFVNAAAAWVWYFSKTSTILVLISNIILAVFAPLVSSSLLTVTTKWYPINERTMATSIGELISIIIASMALLIGPLMATESEQILDLNLKSCKRESLPDFILKDFEQSMALNSKTFCTDEYATAISSFCCYLPVAIPQLNFIMAALTTIAFALTVISVRDRPPTPPSPSGEAKFQLKSFSEVISKLRQVLGSVSFLILSVSDFLVIGPPLAIIAIISRIFPPAVSKIVNWFLLSAILGAIPITVVTSAYLSKTKKYWSFVFYQYFVGTVLWLSATVFILFQSTPSAYIFAISCSLIIVSYIVWQGAVFETKLEYTYDGNSSVEEITLATDRILTNLANIVFIALLAPERYSSTKIVFFIGLPFMAIGTLLTLLIPNRYKYKRHLHETKEAYTNNIK